MRRLLLAALSVGIAVGCVAAVAIPRIRASAGPPPRIGAPHRPAPSEMRLEPIPGTVHVALRKRDPVGGPDWVMRTFAARQVLPPALRHERVGADLRGRMWCAQLLRAVRGQLGWIDGTNVFHRVGFGQSGAPSQCSQSIPDADHPEVRADMTLRGLETPAAVPVATVAWGWGGPSLRAVDVRFATRRVHPQPTHAGAFLAFSKPVVDRRGVDVTVHFPGRPARTLAPDGYRSTQPPDLRGPKPGRGPVVIDARAPDPNGGLPWAVGAVRSGGGRFCLTQPGRIVAGHVGGVDYGLGTFQPSGAPAIDCQDRKDSRMSHHPLAVGYTFFSGSFGGVHDAVPSARVARRTLPGTTIISGFARRDIREVTIQTPRGIRTVAPSGASHALIAVYDGGFPTGAIVLTAHFADGRSRVIENFHTAGI